MIFTIEIGAIIIFAPNASRWNIQEMSQKVFVVIHNTGIREWKKIPAGVCFTADEKERTYQTVIDYLIVMVTLKGIDQKVKIDQNRFQKSCF